MIVCDECGKEFLWQTVKIYTSDLSINNKLQLHVVYFRCPDCGAIYIVQIIDKRAKELQSELLKQNARWQKIVGKNEPEEIDRNQNEYISLLAKQRRLKSHLSMTKQFYEEIVKAHLMPVKNQDV